VNRLTLSTGPSNTAIAVTSGGAQRGDHRVHVPMAAPECGFPIEAKSAATTLRDRHIDQAESYAAKDNIRWVLLTNGVVWSLYHLTFEEGIESTREQQAQSASAQECLPSAHQSTRTANVRVLVALSVTFAGSRSDGAVRGSVGVGDLPAAPQPHARVGPGAFANH
jgi:hypothetical protein